MTAFHLIFAPLTLALQLVTSELPAPAAAPPAPPPSPRLAPPCPGLRVPLIVYAADPAGSVATLAAEGESRGVLRRRGGRVGSLRVAFIAPDRVWLQRGAELCQVEMFRAPATEARPSTSETARPRVAQGAPAPDALPPALAKGIQRLGPTEFRIDGGVRDQILEAQATLLRSARLAPELKDGKTLGYRVFGVRGDNVLGAIGIENGDRIQSINGFELADPQRALEAYARLRTASRMTLTVMRQGKITNLDYEFR